jgi:hypothetical protein
MLGSVKHRRTNRVPPSTGNHRTLIVVCQSRSAVQAKDCHRGSGENAVIDSHKNLKYPPLLRSIAACCNLFRSPACEQIARRLHPASGFGFIAENLESSIPDRVRSWVFELGGELFSRGRCHVSTVRNSRLSRKSSPVDVPFALLTPMPASPPETGPIPYASAVRLPPRPHVLP